MAAPRLEAFKTVKHPPELVPCTQERAWMDVFTERHAYRCLPLTIANSHGWEILVPAALEVEWNGGPQIADLTVRALEPFPEGFPLEHFAMSNFARGIVTFHTGYLFRTPPGWNLLTTGAFNEPRPGISPLTGIIESDWLPYPFTMNWQMLHAGTVRFEKDEVFCTVMPIPKHYLDQWDVAIHELGDDPILLAEHEQFRTSRSAFRERLEAKEAGALAEGWERHYFVGRFPDGSEGADHINKLRLNPPVDLTGTRPLLAKSETGSPAAAALLKTANIQNWRKGSLLEQLDQRQTDDNRAGRLRLRAGVLTPTAATVTITQDMDLDPEAFDFIYQPNFLTAAECALLTEAAEALAGQQHVGDDVGDFWKGRMLHFGDVQAGRPGAAALMRDAQRRVTERLRSFYQLTAPLFADSAQLVRWRIGMHMPSHADRAKADGGAHDTAFRDFASVVYLNDNYEGGELYFPRLDLTVKPAAGMLLAFTGGWYHEHGVLKVLSGERLTMPAFYTFDPSQRERDMYNPAPLGLVP
jgi:hypothetical protein